MAKAIHMMVRVLDEARSLRFYREVFGLEVAERFDFDGFSLIYLRNAENDFEVELRLEPGVVEFDQHAETYVPLEELKANDYERWKALVQGGLYATIDIESFRRGVAATLERIIDEHAGARVAVVCHGGVINAWTSHVLGIAEPLFFQPTYTSVSRFLAAGSGERSVVSLNEAGHLRGV